MVRDKPETILTDASLLKTAGLEPPSLLELVEMLRQRGFDVPYTLDAKKLADVLSSMLSSDQ